VRQHHAPGPTGRAAGVLQPRDVGLGAWPGIERSCGVGLALGRPPSVGTTSRRRNESTWSRTCRPSYSRGADTTSTAPSASSRTAMWSCTEARAWSPVKRPPRRYVAACNASPVWYGALALIP
jgi:hypothetical protein